MFLQKAQKTIVAFTERYVAKYDSEAGDYFKMLVTEENSNVTVEFFISDYSLKAWIDDENGELHIINPETGESIFDYAEENSWGEEDVRYMKFGEAHPLPFGKAIAEDGTYTNYSGYKKVEPSDDFMDMPEGFTKTE